MLTVRHLHDGAVTRVAVDDLADALTRPGFVWVDVQGEDPAAVGVLTGPVLDLPRRVTEDMVEDLHLPKLDMDPEIISITVHGMALEQMATEVTTRELDIAVRHDLVVTYHVEELASVVALGERIDRLGARSIRRPAELLHRLLDVMTDVFLPLVDLIERRLDVIEEDLMDEPSEQTRRDIYELQRDVIQLRRAVVPQAEVIRRLGRDQLGLFTEEDTAAFRDIHDHLFRLAALSDSYRQLLDSAMTNYRSAQDDRLNDMLRVLTLVSAILLPMTLIVGIYGTNFDYLPELRYRWAYPSMLGVFVLLGIAQVFWFRRQGWIGDSAEERGRHRRLGLGTVLEIPLLGQVLRVPVRGARVASRGIDRIRHRPAPAAPNPPDEQEDDDDHEFHGSE